jgi:hypothetical protein
VRLTYASLCDGIGAVHAVWAPLGWRYAWVSEIDPFACAGAWIGRRIDMVDQLLGHENTPASRTWAIEVKC